MASIWTEAQRTRGNVAPDATAADEKSRDPNVNSRIFVAVPWRHNTYWSRILVQNNQVWRHETHIPMELARCVNSLFTGQGVHPSTRTLIQQPSRLRSADPFQKQGVVNWQPVLPWKISKVRGPVRSTAEGTPTSETPQHQGKEAPTETGPPEPITNVEQGSEARPESVRPDCRQHCRRTTTTIRRTNG